MSMSNNRENPQVIDLVLTDDEAEKESIDDHGTLAPADASRNQHESASSGAMIDLTGDDEDSKPSAINQEKVVGVAAWDVILLVDHQEPIEYFDALVKAGVRCERRTLPTFDFLWVARNCQHQEERILGHGFERKTIYDMINALNAKENGMARSIFQKLKMDHSGLTNKHYLVQGNMRDVFRRKHLYPSVHTTRRVHLNMKTMEEEGYEIHTFPLDSLEQVVTLLKAQHEELQTIDLSLKAESFLLYKAMVVRVSWTTRVIAARKSIPKPSLGETKLQCILQEFPENFETQYKEDTLGTIKRLSELKSGGNRRIMSAKHAKIYCEKLFDKKGPGRKTKGTTSASCRKRKAVTPSESVAKKMSTLAAKVAPASAKKKLFEE